MSSVCKVKREFFDSQKHYAWLYNRKSEIYKEMKKELQLESKKNRKFSVEEFYSRLVTLLKSEDTPFIVEYSSDFTDAERKNYKKSIIDLKDALLSSLSINEKGDIRVSELLRILNDTLLGDLNASKLKIFKANTPDLFTIEKSNPEETEEPLKKELSYRKFLNITYGSCYGAIRLLEHRFNRDIFLTTIIDFKRGRYISGNTELNENIASFKEETFKNIVDFLNSELNTSFSYEMYDFRGYVSENYYAVMDEMENYLKEINSSDVINNEYSRYLSGKDSNTLIAIQSYTTLKYFDSLLKNALGKTISFSRNTTNLEFGISLNKYKFRKDSSHLRKNWTDSDVRTAALNTSKFSKFILEAMPLIINGKQQERNVGIMQFQITMTKLFCRMSELFNDSLLDEEDSDVTSNLEMLARYLKKFHNSPGVVAYNIFKLIHSDKEVRSELKLRIQFTDTDLGVIDSVYKFLFACDEGIDEIRTWDDVKEKSIKALEYFSENSGAGKYSIVADIVGVMDDCTDASYILTLYNYNGSIETIVRLKHNSRRISERFKNNLNASVASYDHDYRALLRRECIVTFNGRSTETAHVTIPLNVSDKYKEFKFNIHSPKILGVLGLYQGIEVLADGENTEVIQKVYLLFSSDSSINLSDKALRDRLLLSDKELHSSNIELTDDEKIFKAILQFIDKRLLTNWLSEDGLNKLNIYAMLKDSEPEPYLSDLLIYSVKAQIVSDIYYDFEEKLADSTSSYNSQKLFKKFIRSRYPAFANIAKDQEHTYYYNRDGETMLLALAGSPNWVDDYAYSELLLTGQTVKSTSKNQSGNNDANYVTSFLGGQIHNLLYNTLIARNKRIQEIRNAIRKEVENTEEYQTLSWDQLIKYINSRIDSYTKIPQTASGSLLFVGKPSLVKLVVINSDVLNRHLTVKGIRDLNQSELFYNAIIHNFWTTYINTDTYCILPTTYSDKVKLIQYLINAKKNVVGNKSLASLNTEETIDLYVNTIGKAAKNAELQVIHTFEKLWGKRMTISEINDKLRSYVSDDKSSANDKLIQEAQKLGIELQLDFHYRIKEVKRNGRNIKFLTANEVIPYNAKYADREVLKAKLESEKINFVNNLIDSGVLFYIDYHDTSLYDNLYSTKTIKDQLEISNSPVAKILLKLYDTNAKLYEYAAKWIKNGKLIFAYDVNGNAITYLNCDSIAELNPLLEKFFYMDSLLSNNLRFLLTGFETNHPDKSNYEQMWGIVSKDVNNELINNTTIRNKEGNIESNYNIKRLLSASVIWAHPASGKTYAYGQLSSSIIDFDSEYKYPYFLEICKNNNLVFTSPLDMLKVYQEHFGEDDYKEKLFGLFDEAVKKAKSTGKLLLISDRPLLRHKSDQIDLVLTISREEFIARSALRNENDAVTLNAWKDSIDGLLTTVRDKTIDIGDLSMSDIIALSDSTNLHILSQSQNVELRNIANKLINAVLNISQGTLLKRNVSIPATLHYIHTDSIKGPARKIKVAVIEDIMAKAFSFDGLNKAIESMDGSVFTTSFEAILENLALGSQEVGMDKKPIWHHYNEDTGTAALMKFASFVIDNARMRMSRNSNISLHNIFKKMTNLQWAALDDNGNVQLDGEGNVEKWNTSQEILLDRTVSLKNKRKTFKKIDFSKKILGGKSLYYEEYDEYGDKRYKQIVDFGRDENGYYTVELYVNDQGGVDYSLNDNPAKVYHYFDKNSTHYKFISETGTTIPKPENMHSINSLYELWEAMGGMDSVSMNEVGYLEESEASNFVVVNFMNEVKLRRPSNQVRYTNDKKSFNLLDDTLNSYDLPLKEMMIGYLANSTAMKNGTANLNSSERWYDDQDLAYMEMDSNGLGILMDADHDVSEDAEMTEFSQVIAALESGGSLHQYSKQVYHDLGKVALIASKVEVDTLVNFLKNENDDYEDVKSKLYDLVARTLVNGILSREDQASLTDSILHEIEKNFNKNLNHVSDLLKIPFSDPNIYSLILPIVVSSINRKSIKRKYPGSGMVMIPGYNIILYYVIDGTRHMFNDVVREASEWFLDEGLEIPENIPINQRSKYIADLYLAHKAEESPVYDNMLPFIPTDVVDILIGNDVYYIDLDGLDAYYRFKDGDWEWLNEHGLIKDRLHNSVKIDPNASKLFRYSLTIPRNLAPARITFELEDGTKMNVFDLDVFKEVWKKGNGRKYADTKAILQAFKLLKQGRAVVNGKEVGIRNLSNRAAEAVVSNMFANTFGIGNKSIAEIRKEGPKAFEKKYFGGNPSDNYDVIFDGIKPVYITFESPSGKAGNSYEEYNLSNLFPEKDRFGNTEVYLISDDNRKLFKVGRYILRTEYQYKNGKICDLDGNPLSGKLIKNLKHENGLVYEYVLFVSRYRVAEKRKTADGGTSRTETYEKYYIDLQKMAYAFNKGIQADPNDDNLKTPFNTDKGRKFVINILDGIYATSLFEGIKINPELSRNSAGSFVKYVAKMKNVDSGFKETVLKNVERLVRSKLDTLNEQQKEEYEKFKESQKTEGDLKNKKAKKASKFTPSNDIITVDDNEVRDWYDAYYVDLSVAKYNSWEQSLYITAARIPALNLQSFMQMETIAYTGNTVNQAYVSHWLTWLLGSDYDIDKSYIMGQEFGIDGRLVKWSNLFSYNSTEELRASLWLPTPRSLWVYHKGTIKEAKKSNPNLNIVEKDITLRITDLVLVYNANPAKRIRLEADLIIWLYDTLGDNVKSVYLTHLFKKGSESAKIADLIIADIIKHEQTVISPNLEEQAYKNSISANIRNIVQDLENMTMAYQPVTMKSLLNLANESKKGMMTASMSMMNPLTKYIMLVLNMVGKKVIGIAATAEKIFYNLSYYYNEGIRSNDDVWLRNMRFHKTFKRILNRYAYSKGNGNIQDSVKTSLANINFGEFDNIKKRFILLDQIDSLVRNEFNITDDDINNQTVAWQKYVAKLQEILQSPEEYAKYTDLILDVEPVDIFISLILSAATDNAKELILDKINCGENLAKCHLYLLMLGFNISDVIAFMTTPYVDLINTLSQANMMDNYMPLVSVNTAVKLSKGIIDLRSFFVGTVTLTNEDTGFRDSISRTEYFMRVFRSSDLNKILLEELKKQNPEAKSFGKDDLLLFILLYIQKRVHDDIDTLGSLASHCRIGGYENNKQIHALSDYIDKLVYQLRKARNSYENKDDFDLDREEFEQILLLADETSTLGSSFLKLNQGIPSSKTDLLEAMRKITLATGKREEVFGIEDWIFKEAKKSQKTRMSLDEIIASRRTRIDEIKAQIIENNKFLEEDPDYIDSTLKKASLFGLIGHFNFEYWVIDKKLTKADIVNSIYVNEDISGMIGEDEEISYRDLVSDYYNLIKGTWNIYDVMCKIPHYKSILQLFGYVYIADKNVSIKSHITNLIYDKVLEDNSYVDARLARIILNYVNDLLINSFFTENIYEFPLLTGMKKLDSRYITTDVTLNTDVIQLNSSPGRASFKYAFELALIKMRDDGYYHGLSIPSNKLLQDVGIHFDKDGTPHISLALDMLLINATPYSERTFLLYLNSLEELKTIDLNGISLADWIILYNLFTEQNQYGSDRLTSIFRNSIVGKDSVLELYFSYIGNLDFSQGNEALLDKIGFNMEDLEIRMAPIVAKSLEIFSKSRYIKSRNRIGELTIKKKTSKGWYKEVIIYPEDTTLSDVDMQNQRSNYKKYLSIKLKNLDFSSALRLKLRTNDVDVLLDAIRSYTKLGVLQIYTYNC